MFTNNRHSIRLRGFDYSSDGWYFVTVCAQNRECLFGEITDEKMVLNEFGRIIESVCRQLSKRFSLELDEIQIMPNHVHMIICIVRAHHDAPKQSINTIANQIREDSRAIRESPLHRSLLAQLIGYLKMNSSKIIHTINPNIPVWQRNYYERIIRNEKELNQIRQYIHDNPMNWEKDEERLQEN